VGLTDPGTDAIIVGAGHNGLVAAAYLARAGLRVQLLERRHIPGGAVATEEIFPGYHVSTCSFTTHILQDKVVRDLELHKHGFRVQPLDPEYFVPFPDGRWMLHWKDPQQTAAEIAKFSTRDAVNYPKWLAFWKRVGNLFNEWFLKEPPTLGELQERLNGTPDGDLLRQLREWTIREALDTFFESEAVQASLMSNVDVTSLDEPGQLLSWASVKPNLLVDQRNQGLVIGGMGTLAAALVAAAEQAGATIRYGAEVEHILTANGRAEGVQLTDGQVLRSRTVVSNADPKRTFLRLVPKSDAGAELRQRVEQLETKSASLKFHAAVTEPPDFTHYLGSDYDRRHSAMVRIAPSTTYISQSLADAAAGRPTRSPVITVQVPTVYDESIAPAGRHIVSMWVKFEPARLEEGTWSDVRRAVGEDLIDVLTDYAPNFRRSIIDWLVYTPQDLEARVSLTDGNIHHLDHSASQLLGDRLFRGGGYRTPIAGLYMCGAGTHPGGEVSGAPGHNAAHAVLSDLRLDRFDPARALHT
jgi:phytoene dehydrogenase-like protein